MCKMPFYKMFPADAETDKNFRLMDFAERGFYWSCLNLAWINGGLPSDPEDRARLLSTPREIADRLWVRVSRCFVADADGTLVNPRQERERAEAAVKSEQARQAANRKWETSRKPADAYAEPVEPAGDPNPYARLTSDSVSEPPAFIENSERARAASPSPAVGWATDEQYQVFAVNARAFWQDLIDEDLIHWYPDWKRLAVAEKLLVNVRIKERIEGGQDFHKVFKYTYFTKGEWKREHIPPNAPIPFPVRETVTERAIRVGHEHILKYGRL